MDDVKTFQEIKINDYIDDDADEKYERQMKAF